jgi:hypothetical protein
MKTKLIIITLLIACSCLLTSKLFACEESKSCWLCSYGAAHVIGKCSKDNYDTGHCEANGTKKCEEDSDCPAEILT